MFTGNRRDRRAFAQCRFLVMAVAVSTLGLAGLSGCCVPSGSDSESSGSESQAASDEASEGGSAGSESSSGAAEMERKDLKHLKATAKIPTGADIQKGGGMNAAKLHWNTKFFLTLREVGQMNTPLEEKKKEIKEASGDKLKSMQVEELDDGWMITGKKKSALGTFHLVNTQRKIDGTYYTCEGDLDEKKGFEQAVAICKSLKPKAAKDG